MPSHTQQIDIAEKPHNLCEIETLQHASDRVQKKMYYIDPTDYPNFTDLLTKLSTALKPASRTAQSTTIYTLTQTQKGRTS